MSYLYTLIAGARDRLNEALGLLDGLPLHFARLRAQVEGEPDQLPKRGAHSLFGAFGCTGRRRPITTEDV